jgi:ubiquitin-conjugating enzyme E2 variant
MGDIIIPRNFVLLDELDNSEKGNYPGDCTIGLSGDHDIYLHTWTGLIITNPARSNIGEQFINLIIYCCDDYPNKPPKLRIDPPPVDYKIYCNKVQVVDDNGVVNTKLPILSKWNRRCRMIDVVKEIKQLAEKGKL